MVKPGQRKFLLRNGYTNERLDKMSPGMARVAISEIEKKTRRERAFKRSAMEALVPGAVFYNDMVILSRDAYEKLITK